MKIAMFSETFLPGTDGIVTRLCATLEHLAEEGHEVLLFAPEGGPSHFASARVIGVPAFHFFLYPDKNFSLWRFGLGRYIKEFDPDIIHMLNPAFLGIGAIYYAWRFQIPLIASYHTNVATYARHYKLDFLEPTLWWYFRSLHNHASINLCTSRATLAELDSHGFSNLAVWDRGVDTRLYSSAVSSEAMRQKLAPGIQNDEKILLYVGRVAAEKGLDKLRPCLERRENIHLAIVGDGPHRKDLEAVFAGTRTTFTGFMHGEELASAYASADGFVFPSTTETLGLVLFEAMASGLPIMAAKSAPSREVLEDGNAGVLFDPQSTDSILGAMDELFYNETRRQGLQRRGREIAAGLDWRQSTRQLMDQYQKLFQTMAV